MLKCRNSNIHKGVSPQKQYGNWWYKKRWCHIVCQILKTRMPYWFADKRFRIQLQIAFVCIWRFFRQSWLRKVTFFFPSSNKLILERMLSAVDFASGSSIFDPWSMEIYTHACACPAFFDVLFSQIEAYFLREQIFTDPFLGQKYVVADWTRDVAGNWLPKLVKTACKTEF